jgi:hypothetical protein
MRLLFFFDVCKSFVETNKKPHAPAGNRFATSVSCFSAATSSSFISARDSRGRRTTAP